MIPKELFLSHSSANRRIASAVSETLQQHGIPVWYSKANIVTAQEWQDEIGRALRRCDWFLILLTEESIASRWVKMELAYALNHSQYDNHILPVKIEDCDYEQLSWTLGNFQMVNFDGRSQDAYHDIMRAWGVGLDIDKIVLP